VRDVDVRPRNACIRHGSPPCATLLGTPWRFKSSHPHSQKQTDPVSNQCVNELALALSAIDVAFVGTLAALATAVLSPLSAWLIARATRGHERRIAHSRQRRTDRPVALVEFVRDSLDVLPRLERKDLAPLMPLPLRVADPVRRVHRCELPIDGPGPERASMGRGSGAAEATRQTLTGAGSAFVLWIPRLDVADAAAGETQDDARSRSGQSLSLAAGWARR
jgi:hypothetical protein